MTIIAHIIDTDTIRPGDLVAWIEGDVEVAGLVKGFDNGGDIIVKRACKPAQAITHNQVTDIC